MSIKNIIKISRNINIYLKLQSEKFSSITVYGVNPLRLFNNISSVSLPVKILLANNYSLFSIARPSKTLWFK